MLGAYLRDVNVARPIDCDPIRRVKFFYARNESAVGRKFLDAPITGIGHQNVSVRINRNPSRGIKFSFLGSPAAFKPVSHAFRRCTVYRNGR